VSNKLYTPSEDKPGSLWSVNKYINSDSTEILSDIRNNETGENRDIFREQQRKWHLSKLKGYISDEFRKIEFAD
jgi:hypothetical protein